MTATPRVRHRFRTLAIATCILLVPIAGHAVWDQVEASRLESLIERMQRAGEAVNGAQERRPLTDAREKEASRLYYAAAMLSADRLPYSTPDRSQPRLVKPRKELVGELVALAALDPQALTSDARFAEIEQYVHDSEPELGLMDRAAVLPFSRFSPERAEYSFFVADLNTLCAVGSLRADALSLRGDAAAADALRATVKAARTLRGVSSFVSPGSPGSLRLVLSRTQPDEQALARLQSAFEEAASNDSLATELADRRAGLIESVWPTAGRRPHFSQRLTTRRDWGWPDGSLGFLIARPYLTRQFRNFLEQMNEVVRIVRRPWPERLREVESRYPDPARVPRGVASSGWIPWLQMKTGIPLGSDPRGLISAGAVERIARFAAQNRVAVAALAVERWRRAHGGQLPPSLDALRPQFLHDVPDDPFTGEPLRYRRLADAYFVYSVGVNRQDDGGDVGDWRPDLMPPYPAPTNKDVGIRVPLRGPGSATAIPH